jgi:hypothetical protein
VIYISTGTIAGLHGHLDGTAAALDKIIKEGTDDAAMDVPNPE